MDDVDRYVISLIGNRHVTLETVTVAQARFVRDSPKLQEFVARYRASGTPAPRFIPHDPGPAGRSVA